MGMENCQILALNPFESQFDNEDLIDERLEILCNLILL